MSEKKIRKDIFISSVNEEQSQAFVRLIFFALIYLFYFMNVLHLHTESPSQLSLGLLILFQAYAIVHFIWVRSAPAANIFRRSLAILTDISSVSFGLYLLGWTGLFIYPFYLWIIVGNGMRFGRDYLFGAMALTVIEFGLLLTNHPYWMENISVGMALMAMVVVLPLFFLLLFSRLQNTNERLLRELQLHEEQEMESVRHEDDSSLQTMFNANSLFRRTFLLIVGIVLAVVALFNYSIIYNQQQAQLDVMYSQAKTVARSIALVTADAMVTEDDSFIVEHVQKVLEDNEAIVYTLVSKRGEYSLYNDALKWSLLQTLPSRLEQLQTATVIGEILQSSISEEEVYHLSYPVHFSNIEWGWVSIGFSLKQYEKSLRGIYRDSILLLLVMLLVSIVLAYVLAQWLVRPILTLNSAAKQVALGDLDVKVDINSKDEVGELASSFNHMIDALKVSDDRLRGSNDELEQRVKERTDELNRLNQELDERVKEEMLKRTEQEQMLIQQSRFAAMGEMIGNIAHQWRQPLNALGLLLQNIENAYEMEMLDEAYIKRSVEKGNRLTRTMSQTIDDFRNFFKPNKESEVFAITSALASTMDMVRSSYANNMITIEEDIDDAVCIDGFASEFSQVLLNLLNNAKDALLENRTEGRTIWIRIYEDAGQACIEIEDNAGGIPEAIIEKVFDPYFTTKEEGKGTGIGLYMSKMIIENNMKGALRIQNNEQGAQFTITVDLTACQG